MDYIHVLCSLSAHTHTYLHIYCVCMYCNCIHAVLYVYYHQKGTTILSKMVLDFQCYTWAMLIVMSSHKLLGWPFPTKSVNLGVWEPRQKTHWIGGFGPDTPLGLAKTLEWGKQKRHFLWRELFYRDRVTRCYWILVVCPEIDNRRMGQ